MARQREALLAADAPEPFLERAALELDDALARDAREVMVVRVAAKPVGRLAAGARERVDRSVLGERLQRSVDGGEADAEPASAEPDVELLRAGPVRLAFELADDGKSLRGRPEARLAEELGMGRLRCWCHVQ
jgi:hypothetical protein